VVIRPEIWSSLTGGSWQMDLFVVFHYFLSGANSSLLQLLSWFRIFKMSRMIFFDWPNYAVDHTVLFVPAIVLADGRYLLLLLVSTIGISSISKTCPKE
jgi:hypothetical protein